MPFTPSHAVVALPFVRTPLLPAAIAVGAMTPDLPLFVRGTALTYQVTHTNLLASTLLALALLVLWYALLRPAVRELAPGWLASRLPVDWDATGVAAWESVRAPRSGARAAVWRDTMVFAPLVAISLLLGVASHVVWDAFTHEGRWGLTVFPALDQQWGPLLGYKWLQYGSTVFGLVVLAVFCTRWLVRRRVDPPRRLFPRWVRWSWWLALPLSLAIAWFTGLALLGPIEGTFTAAHLSYRVLPPACAVWGALTVALCAAVLVRRRAAARAVTG